MTGPDSSFSAELRPSAVVRHARAFSLIEVVAAVAIVALGVTAVLGLLPTLSRVAGEAADTQTALGLEGALHEQLLALARRDFDGLAGQIAVMPAAPETSLQFVAGRDGRNLRPKPAIESPPRDQYFLLTLGRFGTPPLAFASSDAVLVLAVQVSWPYRPLGAGAVSDPADDRSRHRTEFVEAVNR